MLSLVSPSVCLFVTWVDQSTRKLC